MTNGGAVVGRGEFSATDFTNSKSFTLDQPFIGIFGFESLSKTVDSLGFYTRLCLDILPVSDPVPVAPVILPLLAPVVPFEPVVPVMVTPVPVIEPVKIETFEPL